MTVAGNVPLMELGTTRIELTAAVGTDQRKVVLEAALAAAGAADGGTAAGADGGAGPDSVLTLRKVLDTSETGGEAFQAVGLFAGIAVEVDGPGDGPSGAGTDGTGSYSVEVSPSGEEMGISCATLSGVGLRAVPRVDAFGVTHFESVMTDVPACSVSYSVFPGSGAQADVLIDARFFQGALRFVDGQGQALPPVCAGTATERDATTGELRRISRDDAETTEVHFFREWDLNTEFASWTTSFANEQTCDGSESGAVPHGRYGKLRLGPTSLSAKAARVQCQSRGAAGLLDPSCSINGPNYARLSAGERLVVFAVNHATGYAGMTTVTVPAVVRSARGANGECAADTAAGGPLTTVVDGKSMTVSRCTMEDLSITGDVVMYPPEIDVRVERRAPDDGVQAAGGAQSHLIRTGGEATTRDEYVKVSTRWRVRRPPADGGAGDGGADAADAGVVDGGAADASACGAGQCPGPIADLQGDAGQLLEVLCSELPAGAPKTNCLKDDSEWVDVPAGVSPLAGHVIYVANSAVTNPGNNVFRDQARAVERDAGGWRRGTRTRKGQQVSVNSLERANWYVHAVGYPQYGRADNSTVFDPQHPPPEVWQDLSSAGGPVGMPAKALGLKNVYRHYEADGTLRERYDRAREHEFRVVELSDTQVVANASGADGGVDGGEASSGRVLLGKADGGVVTGASASAAIDDETYQFLASLLEPDAPKRATTPIGQYSVRLGTDEYGIDCKVTLDSLSHGITGDCGGDSLADVLMAGDLLYIELYLSGNAENVLYRFNFYGLAPRLDYLAAGSKYTAESAVAANDANGIGAVGRAVSQPSLAEFFIQPARFQAGVVDVCTQLDGTTNQCAASALLRRASFAAQGDGTYALTETCGQNGLECLGSETFWQEAVSGIDGARRFRLPVPPQYVAMPGSSRENTPASVFAVVRGTDAAASSDVMTLGIPRGSFSGSHAAAPGQERVGGVDLADGHLSFEHEDMAARQLNEVVRFARVYDNQNKDPSPLGVGWTHNWDGYVVEETPGRYAVAIGGQARPFPSCVLNDSDQSYTCKTDNGHGGKLQVGSSTAAQPSFVYTSEAGVVHRFDRGSVNSSGRGRRKWLLTAIDEGHGRAGSDGLTNTAGWTVLSYVDGTDLLAKVQTRGSLWLDFSYVDVDQSKDTAVPSRIRNLAGAKHFKYLQSVALKQAGTSGPVVLHQMSYTQQRGNLISAQRTTDLPTQNWVYGYMAVPDGASSVRAELQRSELTSAQLHLSDAGGNGDYVQWEASFDRTGSAASYGHVNSASVVTSAVLPGQQGNAFTVDYQSESRKLTRADGVQAKYTLNDYGNVNTAQLPLSQSNAQWGSDSMGGKVRPQVQSAQSGKSVSTVYDDNLRPTSSTLAKAPTEAHETLPAAGVAEKSQLAGLTPDLRYGISTLTTIPGPNGAIQIITPLDAKGHGDAAGITVKDEQGNVALSRSATFNDDGMPLTETDELGRQLTYSYLSQNPLGLPDSVTVKMDSPADGALGTVHRSLHYDQYGRLTGIDEVETGASTSWSYDSQGRKVQSRQEGTPAQVWHYAYAPVDPADNKSFAVVVDDLGTLAATSLVVVTETLDGTSHERKQYYADGLLMGETFGYGQPQALGVRKYRYEKGRMTSSTDERGFVRSYSYDAEGRQTKVEVTDSGGVLRTEASYALDSEGRPTMTTGADGQVTAIEYDILGQAAKWDYGLADSQGTSRDVESVKRDIRGAVTQRTFGSATPLHVLTTTLDGMGRPLTTSSDAASAGGVNEVRQYDGLGRPTVVEDKELGLKDEYEYKDVLGRVTLHRRTVLSGALTLTDTEVRTYEDKGTSAPSVVHVTHTIATGIGKATRTKRADSTVDAAGRVLSSTEWVPPAGWAGGPCGGDDELHVRPAGKPADDDGAFGAGRDGGRDADGGVRAEECLHLRRAGESADGDAVGWRGGAVHAECGGAGGEAGRGRTRMTSGRLRTIYLGRLTEKKLTPAEGARRRRRRGRWCMGRMRRTRRETIWARGR